MSFYRDVYLKSEDWKNLRAAALARYDNRCFCCDFQSPSNDVHHMLYRNLYDVKVEDLVVLCRECHDWIHARTKKAKKQNARKKRHMMFMALVGRRQTIKGLNAVLPEVLPTPLCKHSRQRLEVFAKIKAARYARKTAKRPMIIVNAGRSMLQSH